MQSANAYKLKIGEKRFSAVFYRSPSLVYGGYNYLARQIGDSALASLPFFEDSRQICVLRDLYSQAWPDPSRLRMGQETLV